jgi:hypothetical protein
MRAYLRGTSGGCRQEADGSATRDKGPEADPIVEGRSSDQDIGSQADPPGSPSDLGANASNAGLRRREQFRRGQESIRLGRCKAGVS